MNPNLINYVDSEFEELHGNSVAYKRWLMIEPKFSNEFRTTIMNMMVFQYIVEQMRMDTPALKRELSIYKFHFKRLSHSFGVVDSYPYDTESFVTTHPYSARASSDAKKYLEVYK